MRGGRSAEARSGLVTCEQHDAELALEARPGSARAHGLASSALRAHSSRTFVLPLLGTSANCELSSLCSRRIFPPVRQQAIPQREA